MAFHSPQICLVLDFALTTSLFPSLLLPFSRSRLQNPTYHVKALVVVRVQVCASVRRRVKLPSFTRGALARLKKSPP